MIRGKTIWLVANAASGSNSDGALAALDAAFGEANCLIDRRLNFHEEGVPSVDSLRQHGVDVLVVFAGDGTTNAVVTALYGWEGTVLVLPGGTMNILAHRLHGDAEPAEIISRVAAGRARATRPTILRSRYGDALSGVLAGPGTAWGDVRESLREADVIGTLKGAAEAIGESTGGPKVICRDPLCGRPQGYSAIQLSPMSEGLAVDGYYVETLSDYAKQGMALLRRNFRDGPHDSLGPFPSVRLASPDGDAMGLLIDGEPAKAAGAEETFTLAPCEVDLLATADER